MFTQRATVTKGRAATGMIVSSPVSSLTTRFRTPQSSMS
jgi:hypothetical protein